MYTVVLLPTENREVQDFIGVPSDFLKGDGNVDMAAFPTNVLSNLTITTPSKGLERFRCSSGIIPVALFTRSSVTSMFLLRKLLLRQPGTV
jgi:hypothetical protein